MNYSKTLSAKVCTFKAAAILAAVAASVALPQIFHAAGALTGTGNSLGSAFLPMHLPVLLAGFTCGPVVGLAAGLLSPVISFAVSGMPTAAVLPFMIIELAVYGLLSGLLSSTQLNSFLALIVTQLSGRLVRAGAVIFSVYLLGNDQVSAASIKGLFVSGILGVILQWILIPLLSSRMKGLKKLGE